MRKIVGLFLLWGVLSTGQSMVPQMTQTITLQFDPVFEGVPLELNKKYPCVTEQKLITITKFKCYVSHFSFYKNKQLVVNDSTAGYLIDLENPNSLLRKVKLPLSTAFDEIRFFFGIDDKTNEGGISGGDLDPVNGMYWTWQTGYINMKLEGTCATVPTRDHGFQFHLGGFLPPNVSFIPIQLKTKTSSDITITIELNEFIKEIKLAETHEIMLPGETAARLSKNASAMFQIK